MKILLILIVIGCGDRSQKSVRSAQITDAAIGDSTFKNLIKITNNSIPVELLDDSLAFLILPIQASCPSCRKKTIDSIVSHQYSLPRGRFILISAQGGRKIINSYFREQYAQLPENEKAIFLDTTNQAFKFDLHDEKPTIYYTFKKSAYKKIEAIPSTVRDDLRSFFTP